MRNMEVKKALRLYFVMGTPNSGSQDPLAIVEAALRGGITCFQLREKGSNALEGDALLGFAKKCQALCRLYRVPFIINDDVDLALAINADGVHVGQDDEQADSVRQRIGPDKWLGVSTHNAQEVQLAQSIGADYVGLGPIYPTSTKLDASAVVGTTLVKEIHTAFTDMPIVAIGGITLATTGSIIQAGADGVAVVSAIASAKDPQYAASDLSKTIHSLLE
ncbi:thiamine phosphate synthase [Sporosarcina sp. P12(2017)]|uniref:thiamine phosphate synthase n=1 Tax=unclassified Sporosarcina TaxID=2647733 RepID=UPI000C16B17F|nr:MULTISPECIES: thiamine phosphate synthase [unclassified Sporosarcina]PIC58230.1 thiamine phosphate synthase [Sporosarcina sp. P10]PIC61733.1 thiamine phosphate synthase [Sporosarcina sp. P12(2017)]